MSNTFWHETPESLTYESTAFASYDPTHLERFGPTSLTAFAAEMEQALRLAVSATPNGDIVAVCVLVAPDGQRYLFRSYPRETIADFNARLSTEAGFHKAVAVFWTVPTVVGIQREGELVSDPYSQSKNSRPGVFWMAEALDPPQSLTGVMQVEVDPETGEPEIRLEAVSSRMPEHPLLASILHMRED